MSALIVNPNIIKMNGSEYYRVYSLIKESKITIFDESVRANFPGMLLIPSGASEPLYSEYEIFHHMITANMMSFQVNGFQTEDQYIHYDYSSVVIESDVRDGSTKFKEISWDTSTSGEVQQAKFIYSNLLIPCDGDSNDVQLETVESEYTGNNPCFVYKPASELPLSVMFLFEYTDGTESRMIIPYNDCAGYWVSRLWTCLFCGEESRGTSCSHCGRLSGSWVCAQCNKNNLISPTCDKCGMHRLDSWEQHAMEYIDENNFRIAVPILKMLADNERIFAVQWLAYIYYNGVESIERNPDLAAEYMRIGIAQKDAYCYYLMGDLTLDQGNAQEALEYFKTSADLGYENAQIKVEELLQNVFD